MNRSAVAALVFIAAVVLVAYVAVRMAFPGRDPVPESVILEVDLRAAPAEYVPQDPIAQALLQQQPRLRNVVDALDVAAEDERVRGLVARIGNGFGYPASVQEIRDALARFRAAGKFTIAHAESIQPGSSGTSNYYLASAFEEIYLQPNGRVGFTGYSISEMFFRGALDKLGVVPRMAKREEYKTMANRYNETAMTAAHRESYQRLIDSWWDSVVSGVASGRGLSEEAVRTLAETAPLRDREAVEAGLVDGLAYRDQVYARAREKVGGDPELLFLNVYLDRTRPANGEGRKIALIYGVGAVMQGKSQYNPYSGTLTMGSDSISEAFRAAIADDAVEAIVFRVSSPGGSVAASEAVWRDTVLAKESGRPVVVSMGDVAGSGGYYIAAAADKIVAQPGTVTGSIGVVTGKLVAEGLYEKLGLSHDGVETGRNASMLADWKDFTPEQWADLQRDLDSIYQGFLEKVAAGRGLPLEKVQEVARGRIWTGSDALRHRLVDAIGGTDTAVELAREAAGIAPDEPVQLQVFPRPKSTTDLILERLQGRRRTSSEDVAVALLSRTLETLRPLAEQAGALGLVGADAGVLRMNLQLR